MGARRGRPAVLVVLNDEERETLERWTRRAGSSQALAVRCRIVQGAAAGRANSDVASEVGCHLATASKWRRRFAVRRLDGLANDPRPYPPRKITDAVVEDVLVRTLETAPSGATHPSTRSMAKAQELAHDIGCEIIKRQSSSKLHSDRRRLGNERSNALKLFVRRSTASSTDDSAWA